jgi:hypothetical protein
MIYNQTFKYEASITKTSVTNAATASASIDTLGYDYATIVWILPTTNVVSNNASVWRLLECDTTVVTNHTAVTAFVGDGTGGFTIPNGVTSGSQLGVWNVDLRGRERWLRLEYSPLTTQIIEAVTILGWGDEMPDTTTEAGVAVLVNG